MGNQAFRGTNYLYLTAEHGRLKGEMELNLHGHFHVGTTCAEQLRIVTTELANQLTFGRGEN